VNAENDHEFPDAAKVDKLNKEIANLYDDNEILLGRLYPLLVTVSNSRMFKRKRGNVKIIVFHYFL